MSEFMEQPQVIDQPSTALDRLSAVFHNAVDYIGDALPTPRPGGVAAFMVGSAIAFGVAPTTAEATAPGIVPGQSIDGVNLGDTEAQVTGILGASTPSQFPNENSGSFGTNLFYPNLPLKGGVELNPQGSVVGMDTDSSQFKTSKGIHVGSSVTQLRKAYPKAKCEPISSGSEAGSQDCTLKSSYNGKTTYTLLYTEPHKKQVSQIWVDAASEL